MVVPGSDLEGGLAREQRLVDEAVVLGLGGAEDLVALDVLVDLLGVRPVWCASVSSSQVRIRSTSLAWISMSDAWP